MKTKGNKICFVDRDGTINVNTGYPHKISDLALLPGVCTGIALLNRSGFQVVVVTNQSGIGRGYFPVEQLMRFNQELADRLKKQGAVVNDWRYCPHHPDDDCACRKPKIGMVLDFLDEDSEFYMIGDSKSDMIFAQNIGAKGFWIGVAQEECISGSFAVQSLLEAVHSIVKE